MANVGRGAIARSIDRRGFVVANAEVEGVPCRLASLQPHEAVLATQVQGRAAGEERLAPSARDEGHGCLPR